MDLKKKSATKKKIDELIEDVRKGLEIVELEVDILSPDEEEIIVAPVISGEIAPITPNHKGLSDDQIAQIIGYKQDGTPVFKPGHN